jgi:exodeoxyribonuclease VII large subunit
MEAAHSTALQSMQMRLARRRARLDELAAHLSQLSPLRILSRGYAIVSNESGVLKDPAQAPSGTAIHVRLADGELDAKVD